MTTPGVDRPLTTQAHWRRARGRKVVARLSSGRTVTGRVAAVVPAEGVVLDADSGAIRVAWTDLVRGKVEVEFSHSDDQWDALENGGPDEDDVRAVGGAEDEEAR